MSKDELRTLLVYFATLCRRAEEDLGGGFSYIDGQIAKTLAEVDAQGSILGDPFAPLRAYVQRRGNNAARKALGLPPPPKKGQKP